MKNLLVLTAALLTLSAASLAQAAPKPSPKVQKLIRAEERLNVTCRGEAGDKPSTQRACNRRDRLVTKIERAGWCWGHEIEQTEADKQWEPCTAKNR